MTRQDYVRLAAALAETRPNPDEYTEGSVAFMAHDAMWVVVRQAIADALEADSPRFDRSQFYAATEWHVPREDESTGDIDVLGPCGCVDYHYSDCPTRTGYDLSAYPDIFDPGDDDYQPDYDGEEVD